MLIPVVRANSRVFTRNSCAVRVNGTRRITAVESIEWHDDVPAEVVPAQNDGGAPLGIVKGNYTCSASISVYADEASNFEDAAMGGGPDIPAPFAGPKNLTEDRFQLSVIMREERRTRIVSIINCRIVGRPTRTVGTDGTALVMKYDLQPELVLEDSRTLVNVDSSGGVANEAPEHNYVIVNGVTSPGRASISGLKIPYNWQIQEGYGLDAANMTYRGRGLIRFSLSIAMWQTSHFIQWEAFSKVIEPPSKLIAPFVVQMIHPTLVAAGVRGATLLERGVPERQSNGLWLVTMSCIEWRPQKQVLLKPRAPIPGVEAVKPILPQTAGQRAAVEEADNFRKAYTAANGKPPPL